MSDAVTSNKTSGHHVVAGVRHIASLTGMALALAAAFALACVIGLGFSFFETFVGLMPYATALTFGSALGEQLHIKGWRKSLLPFVAAMIMVTTLWLAALRANPGEFVVEFIWPHLVLPLFAAMGWLTHWQHDRLTNHPRNYR